MITGLYAALSAAIILLLSARVVLLRRVLKVGIGDGGDKALAKAIRAQANAIEYIPICVLLLFLVETNGLATMTAHAYGATLILGRVLHALGLSRSAGVSFGRYWGTLLTWLVMLGLSVQLILAYIAA